MSDYDVLIVGGGHGGAQTAIALRRLGFAGRVAIVSEESDPPYERPPLSKEYLAGERPFERLLIRPPGFWAERDIALLAGRRVEAIEPERHRVRLADGARLSYGALVWAGGGRPMRLPGVPENLPGVHTIRGRRDVDRLRAGLEKANRIAIVGGGYIGLEAAAVLAAAGRQVALIEAADRLLARVAAEATSHFFEAEHRRRGVAVRTGAPVEGIETRGGRAAGLRLRGGVKVPADLVIVAIGIAAAIEPLRAAGAAGTNGVDVDEYCRTALPDVYAVGDCAAHENRFAGGARIRLESVQNAHDQAITAAKAIAGAPEPYAALPWFWSNQYDLRLQTVGLAHGHDAVLVRGDPASRSFSTVYLRGGRVVALDCVNAVPDYVQGRGLILAGASPDPARLADPSIPLRTLAEPAAQRRRPGSPTG